jgi:CheY-like chemotaxis protein
VASKDGEMARILLVDDSAHTAELFAEAIRSTLEFEVQAVRSPAQVTAEFLAANPPDVVVSDLSFAGEALNGADVLLTAQATKPAPRLAVLTDGDGWSAELLRDVWEVLPLAGIVCKASPVRTQLQSIAEVARFGETEPDPLLVPLLPKQRSPWRSLEGFGRLVQHRGHAKLWTAVLACGPHAEYIDLSEFSGLRMNALRNYRAQLLPELSLHGLSNPPMRDLYEFVHRCRPFLAPYVAAKGLELKASTAITTP